MDLMTVGRQPVIKRTVRMTRLDSMAGLLYLHTTQHVTIQGYRITGDVNKYRVTDVSDAKGQVQGEIVRGNGTEH
jgi:hypothetical protein